MLSSSEVSLDPVAPLSTGDLISTVSLFTCQTALKNFPSLDTSTVLLPTTVTSNKNDVTLSPSTFTKSAESFIHEKQTAGNSSCFNRCTQSRVNAATLTKKNTYSKPTKHRHKSQKNSLGHPSPPSITHSQRDTSVTLNLPSSSDQHASILSSYSNGGKDPFFKSDPLQPSLNETMDLDSTGTSLHAYSLPPLRNSLGVSSPNEHGISFKECMTTPFSSTDLQTSFHLDHFHDFKNHPFAESSSSSISLDDDDRGMKSFLPSCWFQEISNHPFTSPFSTVTSTGAMTLESLEKYPYSSGNEHWIQSLLDDPEANLTQSLSLITSEHALSEFPVLPNHSTSKCKDIVSCYSSCAMKITPKSLSYLGTSNTIEHTPLNEATESSILCPSPAPDTKSNPPATTLSNEESVLIKSLTSYIHFSPCKSIKDKELDKCTSESIVDQADLVVPLNALSSTTHATLQSKPNFIEHESSPQCIQLCPEPPQSHPLKEKSGPNSEPNPNTSLSTSLLPEDGPVLFASTSYYSISPPPISFLPYPLPWCTTAVGLQLPPNGSESSELLSTKHTSSTIEDSMTQPPFLLMPPSSPFPCIHAPSISLGTDQAPPAMTCGPSTIQASSESAHTQHETTSISSTSPSTTTQKQHQQKGSTTLGQPEPPSMASKNTAKKSLVHGQASNELSHPPAGVPKGKPKKCQPMLGSRKSKYKRAERRFSCYICEQCFKRSEHLKRHLRIHTGERPFPCPVDGCLKSFSRTDNLTQHLKIHSKPDLRNSTVPPPEPVYTFPPFIPPGMVLSWIPVLSPAPFSYRHISGNGASETSFSTNFNAKA